MDTSFIKTSRKQNAKTAGFSLVELLLTLSLGIGLSGAILQLLISESDVGLRVVRLMRERSVQQRTLALIRDDVQRSSRISTNPQLEQHACNLGGRVAVLHLSTAAGAITYSVGTAPSSIWRGQVLMRCGPAFDLAGQPAVGSSSQNRVVIDGLTAKADPQQECGVAMTQMVNSTEELWRSRAGSFLTCMALNQSALEIHLSQRLAGIEGRAQEISSTIITSYSA